LGEKFHEFNLMLRGNPNNLKATQQFYMDHE